MDGEVGSFIGKSPKYRTPKHVRSNMRKTVACAAADYNYDYSQRQIEMMRRARLRVNL